MSQYKIAPSILAADYANFEREIKLPYDKKSITAVIPDKNFAGLLESKAENYHNPLSEQETVEKSMDNPIGSQTLEELAKGKKDIVLISSDHTRPVPSHIITPIILRYGYDVK